MQKRKFDELISYFNRKVSDMSIGQKYKMELLGMISAIGFAHEEELSTDLAEVGTDAISRQAAIEVIDSFNVFESRSDQIKLEQMIGELPPAQPERIKGNWVNGRCDKCNAHAPFWAMASTYYASNFCPNCGAEMEVTT